LLFPPTDLREEFTDLGAGGIRDHQPTLVNATLISVEVNSTALHSTASALGVALDGIVTHPPVLPLGQHRLAGMGAGAMVDVAAVVVVSHQ
jgi:hypothetical protein